MRLKLFYKLSLNLDSVEKKTRILPKTLPIKTLPIKNFTARFNLQFCLNVLLLPFSKVYKSKKPPFFFLELLVLFFFENRLEDFQDYLTLKFPQKLLNFNLGKKINLPSLKFKLTLDFWLKKSPSKPKMLYLMVLGE